MAAKGIDSAAKIIKIALNFGYYCPSHDSIHSF